MKKPVFHDGLSYFDTVSQHEGPLELAGSYAAMQIDAIVVGVRLATTDHKLSILNRYREISFRKSRYGKGNTIA